MPTILKKGIALLFLGFVALFLVRLALGFFVEFERPAPRQMPTLSSVAPTLKEYRQDCANNLNQLGLAFDVVQIAADALAALEVYTREARIGALTNNFEEDVDKILASVSSHQADVRLESSLGTAPNRSFSVVIRVPEDQFDSCVDELRGIGELQSFGVTKEDKSEEAKQRFAGRESLQTYLDSLTALRDSEGDVSELVNLESKIQQVQKQMHSMNVALGEFVKKESYNNINYTLQEQISFFVNDEEFPLYARIVESLLWTITWYARFIGLVVVLVLTVFCFRVLRTG